VSGCTLRRRTEDNGPRGLEVADEDHFVDALCHLSRLFKFFESNASNVFAFALVLSKSVKQFPCVFIAMLKPIAIVFRAGVCREFGEDFVRIHGLSAWSRRW
jgi:hypothetical protein